MSFSPSDIAVTRRKIVEFGIVMFSVLTVVIPIIVVWRNSWEWQEWLIWLVGSGIILLVLSATTGMLMAPIYRAWMYLAMILGTIMTGIIVTLVFFVLITPIGLIRRLVGSSSNYQKRIDTSATTYWVERSDAKHQSTIEKMY